MNSPWMNGSQGTVSEIPGLAALFAQHGAQNLQAMHEAGQVGGQVLRGIFGAIKAARSPEMFGDTTNGGTPNSVAPTWDNPAGNSPDQGQSGMAKLVSPEGNKTSAIGRFMQGFVRNAGLSSDGLNLDQFAAQGKAAKAYYDSQAADPEFQAQVAAAKATGAPEPALLGLKPSEVKHAGTADMISWFANAKQLNDRQQQALGAQQTKAQIAAALGEAQQRQAQAVRAGQTERANQKFAGSLTGDETPMAYFAKAIQAGVDPERAGVMARDLASSAPTDAEDNTPQTMTGPNGETLFYQPFTKNSPIISPYTKGAARVQEINAQQAAKPDPTKMTDAQRQTAIAAHGRSRTELLKMLGTTPPDQVDTLAAIREELAGHQQAITDLRTPPKAAGPAPKPSAGDVKYLQAHPEQWQNFERRFGKGSTNEILP